MSETSNQGSLRGLLALPMPGHGPDEKYTCFYTDYTMSSDCTAIKEMKLASSWISTVWVKNMLWFQLLTANVFYILFYKPSLSSSWLLSAFILENEVYLKMRRD
jgi:hypothetical protein